MKDIDKHFLQLAKTFDLQETRVEWILAVEETQKNKSEISTIRLPDYSKVYFSSYGSATNALNAGIDLCSSRFVMFVMADDIIFSSEFKKLLDIYSIYEKSEIVNFGIRFWDDLLPVKRHRETSENIKTIKLTNLLYEGSGLCAHLYDRELLKRIGKFDTEYEFCSDRKLLIEIALKHIEQNFR